jgi:hypothetical protein
MRSSHVPLDGSLRDSNAELQKLPSNPFRCPESVLGRHALDQGDDIRSEARLVRTGRAGLSTPEQGEIPRGSIGARSPV